MNALQKAEICFYEGRNAFFIDTAEDDNPYIKPHNCESGEIDSLIGHANLDAHFWREGWHDAKDEYNSHEAKQK